MYGIETTVDSSFGWRDALARIRRIARSFPIDSFHLRVPRVSIGVWAVVSIGVWVLTLGLFHWNFMTFDGNSHRI